MKKIIFKEFLNLMSENKEPIQVEYKGEVYKKHAIADYENEKNGLLLSRVIAEECTLEAMTWSKVITICDEILDDKEKEYLSNIIRPFNKYISKIEKIPVEGQERIIIKYHNNLNDYGTTHGILLPTFKKGTMYKGMESFKEYTLEELGI